MNQHIFKNLQLRYSMIITSSYLYFVKKNKTDAEEFLILKLQRQRVRTSLTWTRCNLQMNIKGCPSKNAQFLIFVFIITWFKSIINSKFCTYPYFLTCQTSKTGHFLVITSALHDLTLVFLSIYNFSSFIFIFDFQEMGGGG